MWVIFFLVWSNPKYIIITHDKFYNSILPFRDWKHKKGIPTKIESLSNIGSTADDIYNYIHSYFDTPSPPEYLLLVGDYHDVPAYPYRGGTGPPCDHYYSLHKGDDHLPDINVGRFPVETVEECSILVDKILKYETSLPTSWGENYLKVFTLTGGWEELRMEVVKLLEEIGFEEIDSLSLGASKEEVSEKINEGRNIVLYLGHGSVCGWNTTNFSCTEARNLTNKEKFLPIVLSPIACLNGLFKYDCLAEAFLDHSHGGVGFWGSITMSYFEEEGDSCAIGFFYGLKEGIYNFQKLCNFGKLYMCKYFDPNTNGIAKKVMYVLTTLGDPELPIWTSVPKKMKWKCPERIERGGTLKLKVEDENSNPIESVYVCCMSEKDANWYFTEYTDEKGEIEIEIEEKIDDDSINVTLTKHNFLPENEKIELQTIKIEEIKKENVNYTLYITENEVVVRWSSNIDLAPTLKIYTVSGREVKGNIKKERGEDWLKMRITHLRKGIYFWKLYTHKKGVKFGKFVKIN